MSLLAILRAFAAMPAARSCFTDSRISCARRRVASVSSLPQSPVFCGKCQCQARASRTSPTLKIRTSATMNTSTWGNPLRNVSQGGGVSISFSGGDERSEPENADYGLGWQGRDGDYAQRGQAESDSTTAPTSSAAGFLSKTMARGRGGAARQGRPPRPFLVIIAIAALKRKERRYERLSRIPQEKPSSPL